MITQEHLEHWLSEMKYQLISIEKEITVNKLKHIVGINIDVGVKSEKKEVFVSFDYLREKAFNLAHLVKSIEDDIKND